MNIPDPQEVIRDLAHLWPHLMAALEHGTNKAREYFDQEQKDRIDPYLAPNVVRYQAKQYLLSAGQDYDLEDIPNNGLCLRAGKYSLRILKADDGGVPGPGYSEIKQLYYRQTSIVFQDGEMDILEDVVNLLVVWDVTHPYNLAQLVLACPKHAAVTKSSVELYWEEPLPFVPTTVVEVTPAAQEEDLPISLNQPATGEAE